MSTTRSSKATPTVALQRNKSSSRAFIFSLRVTNSTKARRKQMAQRTQVLRLYRRALRLAEPYIESDGVQDFMRREMMQEMKKRNVW